MDFWAFTLCEGNRPAAEAYSRLLHQVAIAEEAGLDGYWLAEHHSSAAYSITPSPNLLLSIMARETERLRLGTMVTVLPYNHPYRIAEEVRMLDALSDGRLELGWGRGSIPWEQKAFGVERGETMDMYEASIGIVHRLLTETDVDYKSKWWTGGPATVVPEATQQPYPPEWLTATSRSSLDRAARSGMNVVTAFMSEDVRRQDVERYRRAWAEYQGGRPAGRFGTNAHVIVAETEAEALKYARPFLDGWLDFYVKIAGARAASGEAEVESYREHGAFVDQVTSYRFEDLVEQGVVILGDVEQAAEQVRRMGDSGVDRLLCWLQFGDLDFDFANRSMRLFCEEVIPRVRDTNATTSRQTLSNV
jgi:alkanesulfonate monooxygenase SsuD/methylene tetrahydromethanopterin reductase-like flavin-dependent oxidoreductase (luciferase family)